MALDETPNSPKKNGKKPDKSSIKKKVIRATAIAIKFYLDPSCVCDSEIDDLFSDMEVSEEVQNQEEDL